MSNLKLVADEPTQLERMLLDASRAEQPSEDHKARLRAALGIGIPMSGPLAAPPPNPAPVPVQSAKVASKSLTAAKAAVGVAALALVGAFALTQRSDPAPQPPQVAPAQVVTPPALPAVEQEAPAVSPLPPVEARSDARARAARGSAPPAPSADLSEQIRLIEAARAGVASRDARSALTALDGYSAKFPRGAFGQEAMVLRIRALEQAGDSARATTLAKAFVARFPQSPHVARLKPIAERGASR